MRRETERGAYVSVVKTGAQQAGAVFIVQNHLDGTFSVFAPAPQSLIEELEDDRTFDCVLDHADQNGVDTYLEKQKKFDPDLWIVETESGNGELSIKVVEE